MFVRSGYFDKSSTLARCKHVKGTAGGPSALGRSTQSDTGQDCRSAVIEGTVPKRYGFDLESLAEGRLVFTSMVTIQKPCSLVSPIPPSGSWKNGNDIGKTPIVSSAF